MIYSSLHEKSFGHGGAGYKGCVLVPKLLAAGYGVIVYDLMLFGSAGLPSHSNLKVVTGDIRDTAKYADAVTGCDHVIHMACISNDPSFDLTHRSAGQSTSNASSRSCSPAKRRV
jgi:nucleoside-diphosphate-sugar epimerase